MRQKYPMKAKMNINALHSRIQWLRRFECPSILQEGKGIFDQLQQVKDSRSDISPHPSERTSLIRDWSHQEIRWCGFRRSSVLFILYLIGYLGYIILGAYFMYLLETNAEVEFKELIRSAKRDFSKKHGCFKEQDLEELLQTLLEKRGISPLEKDRLHHNWSWGQSILFTSTVITTIGYGHVAPLTAGGKLFTIGYACIGIPLTLLLLSIVAKRFTDRISRIIQAVFSCRAYKPHDFRFKALEVGLIFFIILSLCHLIPAIVFSYLEPGWNYLDAIYYTFISLTTIGLGDYIPGDEAVGIVRAVYKALIVVYLLLGLMMMSIVAELYYGIPELSLAKYFQNSTDSVPSSYLDRRERMEEAEMNHNSYFRPRSLSLPR